MRSVSVSGPLGALSPTMMAAPARWRPQLTLQQIQRNASPYLGVGPQGLKAVVADAEARTTARFFSSGLLPNLCGQPGMPPCSQGTPQSSLSGFRGVASMQVRPAGFGAFGDESPSTFDLAFTFAKVTELRAKYVALSAVAAARQATEGAARWFWGADDGGALTTRLKQLDEGISKLGPTGEHGSALRAGTLTPERFTALFQVWLDALNSIAKDLKEQPFILTELFQFARDAARDGGRVAAPFLPDPGKVDEGIAFWEKNSKTIIIAGAIGVGVLGLAYVSGSFAAIIRAVRP